jgi:Kef-type K+ transport system membrane component KefB
MVVAGLGAELVDLEAIIGAFVAGLAVNRALSDSKGKEELEFLGQTLFVPMFFLSIGFLIDIRVFWHTLIDKAGLVAGIVGGLIASKFIAAYLTQKKYGYSQNQRGMIWSLSLPQVAATLATAIVGYEAKNAAGVRLIDEPVINTVLVLVVVTSILGPMLTEFYGKRLQAQQGDEANSASAPQLSTNQLPDELDNRAAAG